MFKSEKKNKKEKKTQFKDVDPVKDALKAIEIEKEEEKKKEKKFLTKDEFNSLQIFHGEFEAQKQKVINKKLLIKIGEYERSILQYQIKMKEFEDANVIRDLEKQEARLKAFTTRHKEVLEPIRERLDLPEKFGYDENTLEIKETKDG